MACVHKENSKLKKVCLRGIFVAVVILLFLGVTGYYYWPHLLWKYSERKLGPNLAKLVKIPNTPMPEIDIPEDWIEQSLGCLRFRLPPDRAPITTATTNDCIIAATKSAPIRIDSDSENVRMTVIFSSCDMQDFLKMTSQMHPTRKNFQTMTQLRLEACGAVADDFHWSMSQKEAMWHTYIVSLRSMIVLPEVTRTETFSGKNWDGMLLFIRRTGGYACGREILQFLCECVSCPVSVTIYFSSVKDGEKFDADVARRIIQSIEINCEGM
ncbi:MAG: hypothetical protein ACRC46_02350 [Thermoguttaceae bacterium]